MPRRFGGYEIDLDLLRRHRRRGQRGVRVDRLDHDLLHGAQLAARDVRAPSCRRRSSRAQPYVLAPGSVNPKDGNATPKGDGFELTGHWKFGTGIVHADWVLLSGRDRDRARRPAAHVPGAARRTSRCATRGTSTAWSATGQPRHRRERGVRAGAPGVAARAAGAAAGASATTWRACRCAPMLSLTAAIPSLGAARRAVELFRALLARARAVRHAASCRASAPPRRCASRTRSPTCARPRPCCARCARDLTAHARGGPQLSLTRSDPDAPHDRARRARLPRASCAHVMEGSGASVHYLDHELQRIHRDVQMMSAHTVFDLDLVAEQCGRALLEADAPLFPRTTPKGSPPCPACDRSPRDEVHPNGQEALRAASSATAIPVDVAGHRDRHAGQLVDGLRERPRLLRPHRARASRSTGSQQAQALAEAPRARPAPRRLRARQPASCSRSTARRRAPSGFTEEKVQAIKAWQVATCFSPVERAVLAYTDCLVLRGRPRARRRLRRAARRAQRRRDPRAHLHHLHVRHARDHEPRAAPRVRRRRRPDRGGRRRRRAPRTT